MELQASHFQPMTSLPPKSIVVLDDDPTVVKILARITSMPCVGFLDETTLLEKQHDLDPLAFFVDIHLGTETNGISALKDLRKSWPNHPVIVITGDPMSALVRDALASGANDFIRKPLDKDEVLARLQARVADQLSKESNECLSFENVSLNRRLRTLNGPKGTSYLSPSETELIHFVFGMAGSYVTKAELRTRLWDKLSVSENAVNRMIFRARNAIESVSDDVIIKVQYGVGLRVERRND